MNLQPHRIFPLKTNRRRRTRSAASRKIHAGYLFKSEYQGGQSGRTRQRVRFGARKVEPPDDVLRDTDLSQAKPSQAKPSQAKPSQAKPSQAKPSQAKPFNPY
jgi:hypothetical protein